MIKAALKNLQTWVLSLCERRSALPAALHVDKQLRLIYGGTAVIGLANLVLLMSLGLQVRVFFYFAYAAHIGFYTYAAFKASVKNFVSFYMIGLALIIVQSALTAHAIGDDCAVQLYLMSMILVSNYVYATDHSRAFCHAFMVGACFIGVGSYLVIDEFLQYILKPHRMISNVTEIFFTIINALGSFSLFVFACTVFAHSFQLEFERLNKLNSGLHSAANHDGLTGLYNRTGFKEKFQELKLDRHFMQEHAEYCTAICDIDFFKRINDSYGHEAGDLVLTSVSRFLLSYTNEHLYVCRWGGEEFVILLLAKKETAAAVCEEFRKQISDMVIPFYNKELRITMSFGLAQSHVQESLDSAVRRADKALYTAKAGGRNRVCCALDAELKV